MHISVAFPLGKPAAALQLYVPGHHYHAQVLITLNPLKLHLHQWIIGVSTNGSLVFIHGSFVSITMDHSQLHLDPWITCVFTHKSFTTSHISCLWFVSWPMDHLSLPMNHWHFHASAASDLYLDPWNIAFWPMDHLCLHPWITCILTCGPLASSPMNHLLLHTSVACDLYSDPWITCILTHGPLVSWATDYL